jgi:4-hydroxy-3-polyprenylbenzoate decarboxylase
MRLVVAMTAATGSALGGRLLEVFAALGNETHLILSDWARATIRIETEHSAEEVRALASRVYSSRDLAARISSGTFPTDGMVVCPCSMKTLSAIRVGYSANLITRAGDVTLKQRRRLVLVPREAPLSEIHLENMHYLARVGAVIVPADGGLLRAAHLGR